MTNFTTIDLGTVFGGCHTPPCHTPPCKKPPCHMPPCHRPNHPRPPTHGGTGTPFGNWPADFGGGWSYNPPWPTYETAAPATTTATTK